MYFTTPACVPGCVISLMAPCNNTGRVTSVASVGNHRDLGKEQVGFSKSPVIGHPEAVIVLTLRNIFRNKFFETRHDDYDINKSYDGQDRPQHSSC